MRQLSKKAVVEYSYESKAEMEVHAEMMKSDGWKEDAVVVHFFVPHFKRYFKEQPKGAFI